MCKGQKKMTDMPQAFIKICCISSHDEASLAISEGASALGFVSAMPSGPGVIDDETIADIAAGVPENIETFLLTSHQDAASIIEQHKICPTTTIQLVDRVRHAELQKLRQHLPDIKIVQVIHVVDRGSVEEAVTVAGLVDALLLDSGNLSLPIKELGGTGRTHDWRLSHQICAATDKPVLLAGGLNARNVSNALDTVRPFGVDLCSGVRTDGDLDAAKLKAFISAVHYHQRDTK
jgi:phosphoribosylanthranilate isomerase